MYLLEQTFNSKFSFVEAHVLVRLVDEAKKSFQLLELGTGEKNCRRRSVRLSTVANKTQLQVPLSI